MSKTASSSEEPKKSYRAPALEKGLDVLELMANAPHAMNLTDIARELGRTKQELFRIMASLQSRGYLLRDEAQRYRASTKMFELGSRNYSTQALVARSMPHMERLVDELGESCHLNIIVQDRMMVVARAECPSDVSLAVRVGAAFQLHQRISGRVALAFMNEERLAQYWERVCEPADVVETIEMELKQIRLNGFDLADSPLLRGVKDCAVPIIKGNCHLLGVLCVSYLTRVDEAIDRESLPEFLKQTALSIVAEFSPQPEIMDEDGIEFTELAESLTRSIK
ncbi:HTH-type transcriptional regulator YiaJ [Polystyrenella longa]|uniref:HTH-type transcriptional regulator YiaJ n=1 Tax=Polystyrenella longa TaxID=2528007 RepID=A0A518CLS2_9PLAN|nr:IclR family transcriptional regulator [Polystyrenella longa]QDU80172.1 HTH-type transcriptional regulator YiaJ [Polystyrenella longa]